MLQPVQRVVVSEAQHLCQVRRGELSWRVTRVEPLEHRYEGRVAPLWDLYLCLGGLLEPTRKHGAEVLALRYEDGLVRIDLLVLHHKGDVTEIRAVEHAAHVLNQRVHCHVVQRALLQPPHVQYMEIVEPLVTIKATKDVDPLRADQRGAVPLAAWRRVRGLRRPRRADPSALSRVQDVKLVGAPLSIVAPEEKDLVPDEVRRVAPEAGRRRAKDLGLRPLELLRVEDMEVCQVLVPAVAAEEVEPAADDGHGVGVPRLRQGARQRRLHPGHGLQVNDVHIIEALGPVVAAKHVELACQPRKGVARPGRGRVPGSLRLDPGEAPV
mmetsp:Transcript_63681/g.186300  ORF Transcript_63681/g.186300 Transcript_63681/m.186300 type:complete len:325 (+) Transcript_63681:398-1372(+)